MDLTPVLKIAALFYLAVWLAGSTFQHSPRATRRLRAGLRLARLYARRLGKVEVRFKPVVDRQGRRAYLPISGSAWDHFGDDLLRYGFDVAWQNFKLAAHTPNRRKLA